MKRIPCFYPVIGKSREFFLFVKSTVSNFMLRLSIL